MIVRLPPLRPAVACAFLALGTSAPAIAEDFKLGENPVSVILKWRPTTPDPEQQDFVKATRPADDDLKYQSVKAPKVDRPKLKTKAEIKAMTKGLDAQSEALHGKSGVTGSGGDATVRKLQAAGAESRRRAAEDFAGVGTAK